MSANKAQTSVFAWNGESATNPPRVDDPIASIGGAPSWRPRYSNTMPGPDTDGDEEEMEESGED